MTTTFDQHMSLYIPRVLHSVTKKQIGDIFLDLQLGVVSRVDTVPVNQTHYAAYVHFDWWFDNTMSRHFQDRVKDKEKQARLTYQDGAADYWIVLENKSAKHLRYALETAAAATPVPSAALPLHARVWLGEVDWNEVETAAAAAAGTVAIEVTPGEEQC
jgi:hypothetical protein